MAACSHYKETLVLDVHDALTPDEQIAWEQHCAGCEGCRSEQERLKAFVLNAKDALSVPALTAEQEQALSIRVQRALHTHTPDARPKRMGWVLAPVFAACMVLVVAGWFGVKNFSGNSSALSPERVPEKIIRTAQELPGNQGSEIAVVSPVRVPAKVIGTAKEPPGNPVPDTAAISPEPAPEEIISINKELLEYMDMLEEIESLEQLVKLLDNQQETSLLEGGSNADRFRAHV